MKMRKLLAALTAMVLMTAACGIAAAEGEVRKMETAADADEYIAVFLGEHPEELEGKWAYTADMETALRQMNGIAGMAGQLGRAESIQPAYEKGTGGMKAFYIPCVFPGKRTADIILFVQDGKIAGLRIGAFSGKLPEETGSELFDSMELALPVPQLGELPGILTVPKGEGPFPAVVLLAGSGPSDMDDTVMGLKPFRDIAEGLAASGVAVYRFDKRIYTYSEELAADTGLTPEDEYLEDAAAAVQLVAGQERIDPERVYVLGHSLGGNMIPAAARELEKAPVKARGFIMMAASPRPLDELMREQYEFLYSLMPEIPAELQAEKDRVFADLDKLKNPDSLAEDEPVAGAYPAYWKWLAAYDILEAAEEITEPVLLLQGEEDYQVTAADFAIWQDALGAKENWTMISYPGLTHCFTAGEKAEGSEAYKKDEKVSEEVIRDIAAFISGQD